MTLCAFGTYSPSSGPNVTKTTYLGASIEAFRRKMLDEPDAFPPAFSELFLQSNPRPWGENTALFVWG